MNSTYWLIPWQLVLAAAAAWAAGWGLRRADKSEEALPPGERRYGTKQAAVLGGILFLLSLGLCLLHQLFYEFGLLHTLVRGFLLVWLTVAACIDGKRRIIPLWLTRAGGVVGLCYLGVLILAGTPVLTVLAYGGLGLLLGGAVFLLCSLLSRGGMGMGDVRLFAVLGLFCGWQNLIGVMFWTVLSIAVYGVAQLIRKKMNMRTTLPIGPFALIGMVLATLVGI